MNPGFEKLHPYPFERLARLLRETKKADKKPIDLSIGEPKHPTPQLILDTLAAHLTSADRYPTTRGTIELREAIRGWLINRFNLPATSLNADKHVLPVTGTREALFAIAHCVINAQTGNAVVVTCNPFYQIYEGAAFLAGATPWYVNAAKATGYVPDFSSVPESVWKQCQLLYICSPYNPTGTVINLDTYQYLLELADQYDFLIAADECYSEIYQDETKPPLGLLQAAMTMGRNDFRRCLVFHSLSKRSNVPGMRSGFVAGDAAIISKFYQYRTYHGCSMSPYVQAASIAAWNDETHVQANREQYRKKFNEVLDILQPAMNVYRPEAGFYLWPETPDNDVEFTRALLKRENVVVLPGSFISRNAGGVNPGYGHLRIALVAPLEDCIEAAQRIKNLLHSL